MIKKSELLKKLQLVSNQMKFIKNTSVDEVCKIGIIDIENWEWAQGVGLYGLYRYWEQTGDPQELKWIGQWIDRNLARGLPPRNVNTTAPLLTVAKIAEKTKNQSYLDLCRDWAQWLIYELPKTKFGGFQHVVSDGPNTQQLWDDTLFMAVLFLAQMGVIEKRNEYLQECERQFLLHTHYLADPITGLWYHGWTFDGNHNFARAFWGRGNCWITAFIPDFLEMTQLDCGCRSYMVHVLQAQVETLSNYQSENGMWHTLINEPTSYEETSATAGFAYGILKGIRFGLLDSAYRDMAFHAAEAVLRQIDESGTVKNVSYGTGMGSDLQHYRDIPICPMTYGQAFVILLLSEMLNDYN